MAPKDSARKARAETAPATSPPPAKDAPDGKPKVEISTPGKERVAGRFKPPTRMDTRLTPESPVILRAALDLGANAGEALKRKEQRGRHGQQRVQPGDFVVGASGYFCKKAFVKHGQADGTKLADEGEAGAKADAGAKGAEKEEAADMQKLKGALVRKGTRTVRPESYGKGELAPPPVFFQNTYAPSKISGGAELVPTTHAYPFSADTARLAYHPPTAEQIEAAKRDAAKPKQAAKEVKEAEGKDKDKDPSGSKGKADLKDKRKSRMMSLAEGKDLAAAAAADGEDSEDEEVSPTGRRVYIPSNREFAAARKFREEGATAKKGPRGKFKPKPKDADDEDEPEETDAKAEPKAAPKAEPKAAAKAEPKAAQDEGEDDDEEEPAAVARAAPRFGAPRPSPARVPKSRQRLGYNARPKEIHGMLARLSREDAARAKERGTLDLRRELEERRTHTFKPATNAKKIGHLAAQNRGKLCPDWADRWDKIEKMNDFERRRIDEEMRFCSFQPAVNEYVMPLKDREAAERVRAARVFAVEHNETLSRLSPSAIQSPTRGSPSKLARSVSEGVLSVDHDPEEHPVDKARREIVQAANRRLRQARPQGPQRAWRPGGATCGAPGSAARERRLLHLEKIKYLQRQLYAEDAYSDGEVGAAKDDDPTNMQARIRQFAAEIDEARRDSQSQLSRSSRSVSAATARLGYSGKVTLTLVEARGLLASDYNGKADPFAEVKYGDRLVHRSKVKRGTLEPVWNEVCEFDVSADDPVQLVIALWDMDRHGSHDTMGQVAIPLPQEDEAVDKWMAVDPTPECPQASGRIRVLLEFDQYTLAVQPSRVTPRSRMSQSDPDDSDPDGSPDEHDESDRSRSSEEMSSTESESAGD